MDLLGAGREFDLEWRRLGDLTAKSAQRFLRELAKRFARAHIEILEPNRKRFDRANTDRRWLVASELKHDFNLGSLLALPTMKAEIADRDGRYLEFVACHRSDICLRRRLKARYPEFSEAVEHLRFFGYI